MNASTYPFCQFLRLKAGVLIVIPFLVMMGWLLAVPTLQSIVPGINPMNPLTALIFLLSGIWIMLYQGGRISGGHWIGYIVLASGVLTLGTILFPSFPVRVDRLLFPRAMTDAVHPSRMAPNTAVNFILCGVAMVIAGPVRKGWSILRQAFVILSFFTVYTSILGYLFEVPAAYQVGTFTPMALITAFSFISLQAALIFADTRFGFAATFSSPYEGGKVMRRLIPFILLFPPAIGYLRFVGERHGLYPTEAGVAIYTLAFTMSFFFLFAYFTAAANRSEKSRQAGEDTLRASESRHRTLMSTLGEGVLQVDAAGLIVYCNPAFEQLFGYTQAELVGRNATDTVVPAQGRDRFIRRMEDRKRGVSEQYRNEVMTKDGKRIYVAVNSNPLRDSRNIFIGTVLSIRDITEDTLNLQDLQAFTGSAAHDLRSPLASIEMLADLLRDYTMDDEARSVVTQIQNTSSKMRELLGDLLEYSRLGATELPKEKIDMNAMVGELINPFRAQNTSVSISVGELPFIQANPSAARQLFTNLVSNAVKYSSRSESPKVSLHSAEQDGRVWFVIADNGIGMKEEHLSELFTPFKRFTRDFEGTGLGLAIVRRIVDRHNGQVYATLNPEGGMRFHVTLTPQEVSAN